MSTRKKVRSIKVKITSTIENIDTKEKNVYNLEGTIKNNIIKFYDNEYNNTVTINNDKISVLRYNSEVEYELIFENNKRTNTKYLLKEYNLNLDIIILTKSININKNSIIVKYLQSIDSETEYVYSLNWEGNNE